MRTRRRSLLTLGGGSEGQNVYLLEMRRLQRVLNTLSLATTTAEDKLTKLLLEAQSAHKQAVTEGRERDEDWPRFYARYILELE